MKKVVMSLICALLCCVTSLALPRDMGNSENYRIITSLILFGAGFIFSFLTEDTPWTRTQLYSLCMVPFWGFEIGYLIRIRLGISDIMIIKQSSGWWMILGGVISLAICQCGIFCGRSFGKFLHEKN